MKVVYTQDALRDLSEIIGYLKRSYPTIVHRVEARFRIVLKRIGRWPESAEEVSTRPGVRVVPLVRYPYKIFYRVVDGTVEILHTITHLGVSLGEPNRESRRVANVEPLKLAGAVSC